MARQKVSRAFHHTPFKGIAPARRFENTETLSQMHGESPNGVEKFRPCFLGAEFLGKL
jgi:hypothetical protein